MVTRACGGAGLAGDAKFSNSYPIDLASGKASDAVGQALLANKETNALWVPLPCFYPERVDARGHCHLDLRVGSVGCGDAS